MMLKLVLLNLAQAFAEEGGEHLAEHAAEGHHEGVPWELIGHQSLNFFFLCAILFFLLRKTVKAHFADRAQSYRELVDRAEKARTEAEASNREMKNKLAKLEAAAAQSASQAKTEAEQLRAKLIEEAKTLSRRMEQEAQRTAALELEKAKAELRAELLEEAIVVTEDRFKNKLGASDQKQLQNEFAEKIEVVGT